MPWIIVIGLTGIYLNHSDAISYFLPNASYDEAQFDEWPTVDLDEAASLAIAKSVAPNNTVKEITSPIYHDRKVFYFDLNVLDVIVSTETGHYWTKARFLRRTYDPNGKLLNTKIYWESVFYALHTDGWLSTSLGSWIADITAGAMVVFGLSGLILFINPRLRRRRNRMARSR